MAGCSSTRGNASLNPMQISCLQDININRTRVKNLSGAAIQSSKPAASENTQTENLCDVTYLAKSGSSAFVNRSAKLCSATADTSDSP